MAQAANIVVKDRATPTPVDHTFVPRDVDKGIATFAELATVPVGDKILTIRWRKGENGRDYYRLVLTVPVMVTETINGVAVPKVVRVSLSDTTLRFDATATDQERADHIGMHANMFAAAQAVINSTIVGRQGIW